MKNTKWILGVALVLIGFTAGCTQQKNGNAEPARQIVRAVHAEPLETAKVAARSEYIAVLKGDVETELSFKVGGILEILGRDGAIQDWEEGALVKKGEVLARLKQEDFVSSLKSAQAKAEMDRQKFAREVKLHEVGAVSQQELEAATASRLASDASLSIAMQALKDSVLTAPYDGTIVARSANAGETAGVGKPVLKIADLRSISVELGIPDRLVSRVRVGKEFPVRVTTLEARKFVGRVSEVGVAAKDGARLFRVVIKVANLDGLLRSGMTASVSFDEYDQFPPGATLIPLSALVSSGKGKSANQLAVFIVNADGRAFEREVRTDDLLRSSIIVTQGVKPGETVVTAGASTLFDGAPVDARLEEKL